MVSGNLCMVMLIVFNLVLMVGYCLLIFLKGKVDKVVVLCFVLNKGFWCYEIYDIEGCVDLILGKWLKVDGDGWIVFFVVVLWDFGLIVLCNFFFGIMLLLLFEGDKVVFIVVLKVVGCKVI